MRRKQAIRTRPVLALLVSLNAIGWAVGCQGPTDGTDAAEINVRVQGQALDQLVTMTLYEEGPWLFRTNGVVEGGSLKLEVTAFHLVSGTSAVGRMAASTVREDGSAVFGSSFGTFPRDDELLLAVAWTESEIGNSTDLVVEVQDGLSFSSTSVPNLVEVGQVVEVVATLAELSDSAMVVLYLGEQIHQFRYDSENGMFRAALRAPLAPGAYSGEFVATLLDGSRFASVSTTIGVMSDLADFESEEDAYDHLASEPIIQAAVRTQWSQDFSGDGWKDYTYHSSPPYRPLVIDCWGPEFVAREYVIRDGQIACYTLFRPEDQDPDYWGPSRPEIILYDDDLDGVVDRRWRREHDDRARTDPNDSTKANPPNGWDESDEYEDVSTQNLQMPPASQIPWPQ